MDHYVLLYHFDDQESEQHFEERIRQHFGRHKVERNGETTYFGFAGQEEPGVVGKIKSSLHGSEGAFDNLQAKVCFSRVCLLFAFSAPFPIIRNIFRTPQPYANGEVRANVVEAGLAPAGSS